MSDVADQDEGAPLTTAEMRRKAGHQEILGETIAKFEFFHNGWHPYTRFLDVEKIDLILRRRKAGRVDYREVQVKYGKLYECGPRWERALFSVTSWRFFTDESLTALTDQKGLYLAYVLAPDDGFKGDMFIFPIDDFAALVRQSDRRSNGKYRVYFSRSVHDPKRWYLRRLPNFTELSEASVIEVTPYYRNFGYLG